MRGALILVAGTGTDVGKTHVADALVRHASRRLAIGGFKPVESGVVGSTGSDGARLAAASNVAGSMFHVKHPAAPYLFRRAVSPHLAARDEGVRIELGPICSAVDELRGSVDHVLVELAGGLFSPLAPGLLNIDLATALAPTRVILVALDRLGVLHDVGATTRAAGSALGAPLGIVLNAPPHPDASTGTNAAELALVTRAPLIATVPRADVELLADGPDLAALFAWSFGSLADRRSAR